MARKRRRGAASAGRRQVKATNKLKTVSNNTEFVYEYCTDDSTSGTAPSMATTDQTSSSENSNTEMKIVTEGVHKKFGKFRCVIEETVEAEDPLKIDNTQNEVAYVDTDESLVDSEVKPLDNTQNEMAYVDTDETLVDSEVKPLDNTQNEMAYVDTDETLVDSEIKPLDNTQNEMAYVDTDETLVDTEVKPLDNTQNEMAYVDTDEALVDSEVKPFLDNEMFAVEEVQMCSSGDVSNDESVQIIAVEENSASSDQSGMIYISLNENEKDIHSLGDTNEHLVEEVNEEENDNNRNLIEISHFDKNHEDNATVECNVVNNEDVNISIEENIASNEDNVIKNEDSSDNNKDNSDNEKDYVNNEDINAHEIISEDQTEEGIVYMHEEELQLEEVVDNEEEVKIANKLSALNVNVENENMDVINNDEDSQKSNEIVYEMENLGIELTIECGPEEVVPTEQEIEYGNEDSVKEVEAEEIETTKHEMCIEAEITQNKECEEVPVDENKSEITASVNDTEKQQLVEETELMDALKISKDEESKDIINTDEKEIENGDQKEILETVKNEKEDDMVEKQEEIKKDGQECINVEQDEGQTMETGQEKPSKKQKKVRKIDKKPTRVPTKAALKEFNEKKTPEKKKEESQEKIEKTKVRRSTRIKSIGIKQTQRIGRPAAKTKGQAKSKRESDSSEGSNFGNNDSEKSSMETSNVTTTNVNNDTEQKPVKVKSRWRRSSELEMGANKNSDNDKNSSEKTLTAEEEIKIRLKQFVHLKDNSYLTDRVCCKEAKKMVCDCFLTQEEVDRGEYGCGEDCLNRLLMIECGTLCSLGDRCTNKRFQKAKQSACEVFRTEKKGLGIRATKTIPDGEFILEYVGEVINPDEFEDRATEYSKGKNSHFYFMALRSDAVIDATQKGNISRFINHSCEPNAETQKWTVNGELRIGFFSKKTIQAGEEITFDYHFQRYGKEAQKCYCEAPSCRGWLGEEPDDEEDEDEAEEVEEEEEEEEIEEDEETEDKKKDDGEVPSKLKKDVVAKEKTKKSLKDESAKEESVLTDELKKSSTETPEKIKSKEEKKKITDKVKTVKIKPNRILRKTRKELFDDSDLNEEIQTLMSTGLKNQAHTLKLSRLMVRATEITQKSNLLRVLRRGEFPCRRLFLDYHGLRLIHGWMTDAQRYCKADMKQESLRLEILQTLATLPIPNKTMLQDSKVLLTVEKWSVPLKKDDELDSDSNSPKLENEEKEEEELAVEETQKKTDDSKSVETMEVVDETKAKEVKEEKMEDVDEFEVRKSVGMDYESIIKEQDKSISSLVEKINVSHFANLFEDDILNIIEKEVEKATKPEVPEYEVEIVALALKLLEEWSTLKEVFRIPKKERIERMKEHEREANRGYKPTMENDLERKRLNRYRQLQRPNRFDLELRMRKPFPILDQRIPNPYKFNKHERRKLFALQVEQEEEKRRKMHSFMKHEVAVLGPDLRLGPQHDVKYQYMWNPQTGQWQKVQILNQNPTSISQTPPQKQPMVPHPPPMLQNMGQPAPRLPYPFNSYSTSHPPIASFPPIQPNVPQVSHYPPIITSTGMPPVLPHTNRLPDIQNPNLLPSPAMTVPPHPVIPPLPSTISEEKIEDVSQVRFAGPIPPPVKLPPKWKCAKDKYGRPYYYHVKIRISQWEPPVIPLAEDSEDESSETTSSSDSSSLSSESDSEDSDSDEDEVDDTKLMIEIKKNLKNMETKLVSEQDDSNSKEDIQQKDAAVNDSFQSEKKPSLEERLKMEFNFLKNDKEKEPPRKRKRSGLVTEVHIISPRTEEDKILAKENLKKYKDNKEKLKRQKELLLKKVKQPKDTAGEQPKKRIRVTVKSPKHKKHKEKDKLSEVDNETAKKIKEAFRSSMASVMVNILNPYRKPDCKEGHIGNNEDFKHLARKLTHFVMLKELKHCKSIEDLTCTDSVKNKAKEFVRKYMAKFGEQYVRPKDEMDF